MADIESSVADFLDGRWRAAMASTRESMGNLRDLTPELDAHLPETTAGQIRSALHDIESAYTLLHRAGPLIIGEDEYRSYLEAQTQRQIGT